MLGSNRLVLYSASRKCIDSRTLLRDLSVEGVGTIKNHIRQWWGQKVSVEAFSPLAENSANLISENGPAAWWKNYREHEDSRSGWNSIWSQELKNLHKLHSRHVSLQTIQPIRYAIPSAFQVFHKLANRKLTSIGYFWQRQVTSQRLKLGSRFEYRALSKKRWGR